MKITTRETIKSAIIGAIATVLAGVVSVLQSGGGFTWDAIKPALIAGEIALLSAVINFLRTDTVASAKKDIAETLPEGSTTMIAGTKKVEG